AALEREVSDMDSAVSLYDVASMDEKVSEFLSHPRFRAVLLGVFAALAVILAAVGIYGILSQSVSQRTQEIGVRIALGAQTGDVLKLVVGQGILLTVIGLGAGLAASVALTRFLSSLLYGVSATDPRTLAGNALLIIVVALIACYVPARRAARV